MESVNIIQWNCRSLRNKQAWLNCAPFARADVLVFQETFFSQEYIFNVPNKVVYRLDRAGRPGGGLLIAVNSAWASSRINFDTCNVVNDFLGIRIHFDSGALNIINVYSRSGVVTEDMAKVCQSLQGPSLMLGDFNLHHPLWGAAVASRDGEKFVEWLGNSSFCILNTSSPTHVAPSGACSLIDLSFCSAELLAYTSLQVEDDLYDSDHFPISVSVSLKAPYQSTSVHFRWDRVCQEVNDELASLDIIDYDSFLAVARRAMNRNRVVSRSHVNSPPAWWSRRCSNLLMQKKFLLRKARQLISTEYWIKYKRTSAKLRQVIRESKRYFWDSVCKNASDPLIIFKVFRKVKNRSSSPPDAHFCLSVDNCLIPDAAEQAEIFADHFSTEARLEPLPIDYGDAENDPLNRPFDLIDFSGAIGKTKVSTPGEDKISAALYKGLNELSRKKLLGFLNDIWSSGNIPPDWRSAVILPILKPGKRKTDVGSFRPIALTSVLCKIFERMIAKRISHLLLEKKILHCRHLGFQPFRDSHTAVTMIQHDISLEKRRKRFIVGISLDLQAAYDSIYIDGLISKCAQIGIYGPALRWLHRFLNFREIKVAWRGLISQPRTTGKGVPQGAVLSPLLFTIFMHDFFEALEGLGIKFIIYADDIFIYCANVDLDQCHYKLQEGLRYIARWCQYWKLDIRADKCHAINLSRRRGNCDFDFSVNNGLIEWTDEIKFLGFYITRRGGLRKHVDHLRQKAFIRLNILKSLAQKSYGARTYHLLTLVKTSIRSLADYCAAVLNTATVSMFNKLEVMQTSAVRVALGLPRWVPNIIARKHADCPMLADRIASLAFGFWIKHSSLDDWSPLGEFFDGDLNTVAVSAPGVAEVLDDIDGQLEQLIPFQPPLLIDKESVQFHLTDLPFQRTDCDDRIIFSLFSEFMQEFSDSWSVIATDASKSSEITAIAGCTETTNFMYRIHPVNSIFTAEALAIGTALDELMTNFLPTIILTDSLSVLSALQSVSMKSPRVVVWLHNKLQRCALLTVKILICWVPGHRGIPLNEKADSLAKGVRDSDVMVNWISPEDLIRYRRLSSQRELMRQYRGSKYALSHGDIPSVKNTFNWAADRREDVLITRLLCRMLITPAILFRFGLVEDDKCGRCHVTDSLEHILFVCTKYHRLRRLCWDGNVLNSSCFLSFRDFCHKFCCCSSFRHASIRFLKSTGRF